MGRAQEGTARGSLGFPACFWSPVWNSTLCRQLPQCKAPSFMGCITTQVWLPPSHPTAHLLHTRLLCCVAKPCEELLARGTELPSHSVPEQGPTHRQPNRLLPTLLLAASILPLVPSAITATGLPNRHLPCCRGEDEIYDDVEPVRLLRRGQGFLLPSVSRPPAYPRSGGGGYRKGWDAGWGECCSSESLEALMSHGQQRSPLLPCTGGQWVSLLPCKWPWETLILPLLRGQTEGLVPGGESSCCVLVLRPVSAGVYTL